MHDTAIPDSTMHLGAARQFHCWVTRRDEYFLHRAVANCGKQIASKIARQTEPTRVCQPSCEKEKSGGPHDDSVWRWLDSALKGTSKTTSAVENPVAPRPPQFPRLPLSQRFKQPRQRLQRNGGRQKDEVSRRGASSGRTS